MTDQDKPRPTSDLRDEPISRRTAKILGALGGLVVGVILLITNPLPTADSTGALIGSVTIFLGLAVGAGVKWAIERNDKAWRRWEIHKSDQARAAAQRSAERKGKAVRPAKRSTSSTFEPSRPIYRPKPEPRDAREDEEDEEEQLTAEASNASPYEDAPSTELPKPEPRLVRDAAESEGLAAEWIRYMGWPAARPTVATGDNGIDVMGQEPSLGVVAAQVKFEAKKTGRPAIQGLYGAGHGISASHWMFFSSAGYSPMAVEWADQMRVGLFRFTLDGAIEPNNATGRLYIARHHIPQ